MGDNNEAPASYFAMMAGVGASPFIDASESEIWEITQVILFLQMHKYGLGRSALSRDWIHRRAQSYQ